MESSRAGGQLELWPRQSWRDVEQVAFEVGGVVWRLIVASTALRRILETVRRIAVRAAPILLLGESGVGKNLIARLIHFLSGRKGGPFADLEVASMPETLLESELFGHEKGAFTGAYREKRGKLEQAQGGSLFLDEVGDFGPLLQLKLLRVLDEGTFERVGGTQKHRSDTRLIVATHRDLDQMVSLGQFRKDLLYRINALPVRIPPLRERREEIPALAEAFAESLPGSVPGRVSGIHPETHRLLCLEDWPGNVRQLRNWVEAMLTFDDDGLLGPDDFLQVKARLRDAFHSDRATGGTPQAREELLWRLEAAGWKTGEVAREIGISRRQLNRRMRSLGIVRKLR